MTSAAGISPSRVRCSSVRVSTSKAPAICSAAASSAVTRVSRRLARSSSLPTEEGGVAVRRGPPTFLPLFGEDAVLDVSKLSEGTCRARGIGDEREAGCIGSRPRHRGGVHDQLTA